MTEQLETKAFGAFAIKDADSGEVEAIVATLGVVDRDGDVILPGAVPDGARVKLSGYAHNMVLDGAPPAGKGAIFVEGDKAIFRGRFFLSTTHGREAFHVVKELAGDGEWSFGFPKNVKTADLTEEWRAKGARRLIAGLEPVEASPVWRGAGRGTRTVTVKAANDSLTDRLEAVNNALWARNEAMGDTRIEDFWYAEEVFDDHVIVRAGSRMFRVAYGVGENGAITLGDAVEVEIVYQPVAATEDGEAAKAAEAAELKTQQQRDRFSAAVDEFERIQRSLRRIGLVV